MILPSGAVLFQIKRSFPWLDPMAWLFREILVTDAHNRVVASVTRVWHPLYRRCASARVLPTDVAPPFGCALPSPHLCSDVCTTAILSCLERGARSWGPLLQL